MINKLLRKYTIHAIAAFLILACVGFLTACNSDSGIIESSDREPVVYFIDSNGGDDDNSGTVMSSPWKSLSRLEQVRLYPGDSVRFKRGSNFKTPLIIDDSGNAKNYLTVTDYGDKELSAPAFTNTVFEPERDNYGNCIRLNGSYIMVENLYFHHTVAQLPSTTGGFTTMWELGAVIISRNAEHCVVRNNEFLDCGVAIKSNGRHALITNNYIHDCNRVLKEWGWGPIGIWLSADAQEVSYNRVFNYSAVDPRITWGPDSYGGGADGGAIEIDDARYEKSNISIHHNYTRDCQGFLEVTWTDVTQKPDYRNFQIHHNISDDYQQFIAMWQGANCRIENNTIIRRKVNVNDWGVFNITEKGSKNMIRNNIVVVENGVVVFELGKSGAAQPENIIENNLFYAASGELLMGKDGPGTNPSFGNPVFKNYANAVSASDFAILVESPAIDKGIDIGYEKDFLDNDIPGGEKPDLGAFEYQPGH